MNKIKKEVFSGWRKKEEKSFKLNILGDEWEREYNEVILSFSPSFIICAFIVLINFAQNIKSVRQKIKLTHSLHIMETKRKEKSIFTYINSKYKSLMTATLKSNLKRITKFPVKEVHASYNVSKW